MQVVKILQKYYLWDHTPTIRSIVHDRLQKVHEEWSKQKLKKAAIYGIRSYKKGSTLLAHKDKIETHHISCIIIVDRDATQPNWPLDIQDHQGNWHKIYGEPGDMILYESAACEHARFRGKPR